jgi:hypothetical protein
MGTHKPPSARSRQPLSREELLRFAEQVRAEDPLSPEERESLAGELESMASAMPRLGRPKESAAERVDKRIKRARIAEDIYQGAFPERLCPEDLHLAVRLAKGNRTGPGGADAIAGEILGARESAVSAARRACYCDDGFYPLGRDRRGKPMDSDAFAEYIELELKLQLQRTRS